MAAVGCNPASTRPQFLPHPEAPAGYVDAARERLTPELAAWLTAQGLAVQHASVVDGFVETAWFDAERRRSYATRGDVPDLAATFKIRCWVAPDVAGASRLVVEAVYRPVYDPSRPARDLETLVPRDHEGHRMATALLEEMKKQFGVPPGR
ncbi:MAG: hypothetical protein ACREMJ_07500 [Gemmatimonadales bacterium]